MPAIMGVFKASSTISVASKWATPSGGLRKFRAKHNGCGVVLHTSNITPSLRSTAAHEGAMAVVEKGTLDAEALKLLVMSAAAVGPKMKLQQH